MSPVLLSQLNFYMITDFKLLHKKIWCKYPSLKQNTLNTFSFSAGGAKMGNHGILCLFIKTLTLKWYQEQFQQNLMHSIS